MHKFRENHRFVLYHGTTDHAQATENLYQFRLRVECTISCNLQSRARTHAIFVIGLYELLGNNYLTH